MPNANAPLGLRPISNNGQPFTGQGKMVCFPATDANNIFLGDPVVPTGVSDANGVPIVTIATAGATNAVLGAFLGRTNGPSNLGAANALAPVTRDLPVYRQANVLTYGLVSDDPNQVYAIQEDSVGGAIAAAVAGFANANLVAGAGSTVTGYSGWQLQSSSVALAANPTYQLKILGLIRGPDNLIGANAKWAVRLNLPALWAAAGY